MSIDMGSGIVQCELRREREEVATAEKQSEYHGHEQVGKLADMEFVQKFTPPDFKVKNFTPSISPYFNSFSGKKHKK